MDEIGIEGEENASHEMGVGGRSPDRLLTCRTIGFVDPIWTPGHQRFGEACEPECHASRHRDQGSVAPRAQFLPPYRRNYSHGGTSTAVTRKWTVTSRPDGYVSSGVTEITPITEGGEGGRKEARLLA